MPQNNQLKLRIMRRVYTVFIMRRIVKPLTLEVGFLVALIGITALFVSLPHIFTNMLQLEGIQSFGQFLVDAFLHTKVIVQILSILVSVVVILSVINVFRRVKEVRHLSLQNI